MSSFCQSKVQQNQLSDEDILALVNERFDYPSYISEKLSLSTSFHTLGHL